MKTFVNWCDEKNLELELPVVTDTDKEIAKTEQRSRTGWSGNYPPAYFAAQYPHKYVNPRKATTDLDAKFMK